MGVKIRVLTNLVCCVLLPSLPSSYNSPSSSYLAPPVGGGGYHHGGVQPYPGYYGVSTVLRIKK